MVSSISQKTYVIKKKYPFLENFPFPEFQFEPGKTMEMTMNVDGDADVEEVDSGLMQFKYSKDEVSLTVFVFENELKWLDSISSKIKDLNDIRIIIDDAISKPDIISKRNGANYAEAWCFQLNDDRSKLSYSTSGEIIGNLVNSHEELVSIINKIVKFNSGIGMVGLTTREYQIILTYYQFQLIYAKLLLGIVIASKISL